MGAGFLLATTRVVIYYLTIDSLFANTSKGASDRLRNFRTGVEFTNSLAELKRYK